ncbi:MAG: BspA family leucine-rich repeat surface protein [Bacteroidales bacterium]|nr:BspA family leucine-rich repeat surface protein [Bacteroidales bacterium]
MKWVFLVSAVTVVFFLLSYYFKDTNKEKKSSKKNGSCKEEFVSAAMKILGGGKCGRITNLIFSAQIPHEVITENISGGIALWTSDGDVFYGGREKISLSDCENMFKDMPFSEIDLSGFDTKNVRNMSGMFSGCKELTSVYFGEQFSTENVTDFSSMFEGCETLSFLDLSGFKTEKLENTERMFAGCKNLSSLNLESFDVRQLKNSSGMFEDCQILKKVINPSKGELKL